jgi:hypothetical protein
MRRALFQLTLAVLALLRLCHVGVVWVEEAYPLAAARAMLAGRVLYRDVWFDKPPLFPCLYTLFGAHAGWPLRLAGVAFVLFTAWSAWRAARQLFASRDASRWAALLTAFFLTCDFPAAAMALTPDLLALPFHLLAVGAAATLQPWLAGLWCGIAIGFNSKAVLFVPACLVWMGHAHWRARAERGWISVSLVGTLRFLAGLIAPLGALALWLAARGALADHWREVWAWGAGYSRDALYAHPLLEGLRRTIAWSGFHLALIVAAGLAAQQSRNPERSRERKGPPAVAAARAEAGAIACPRSPTGHSSSPRPARPALPVLAWVAFSLAGVWLGGRYFPRYFFQLLPALALPAACGFARATPRRRAVLLLLLAIPALRFAPVSLQIGWQTLHGRMPASRDLALYNDARRAASLMKPLAQPSDALLVWGYRPELYVLTGLVAGTRYLDSQPLNGVLADRHLTSARPTFAGWAARNRQALYRTPPPAWICDGLGPINARLAVFDPSTGLAAWRDRYRLVARTATIAVYRLAR